MQQRRYGAAEIPREQNRVRARARSLLHYRRNHHVQLSTHVHVRSTPTLIKRRDGPSAQTGAPRYQLPRTRRMI